MPLTPQFLLSILALLFAVGSMAPFNYSHHLLAVAVILLSIVALLGGVG